MKNVFKYQTDNIDINNFYADDIKYYVCMDNWPKNLVLNPTHAMMFDVESKNGYDISDSSIPNSKKLVKHDFTRYLALKLFNSTRGVDLISNEFELIENLAGDGSIFTNKCAYNILYKLNKISTTSTDASMNNIDNNGNKYLTNSAPETENIVRSIMEQINYLNPQRFNSLVDSSDNTLMRSIPFKVGDRLSFSLTIKPAADQHLLTGVPLIPDRIYLISLIIGENVQLTNKNLQVMDSAFIGDFPYSKYSPSIIPYHESIFNSNSAPYYAPNSPPASIPNGLGYLNSGWYFSNEVNSITSTSTKINWSIKPTYFGQPFGYKVSDLKYIYITGQFKSTKTLPAITITSIDNSNNSKILEYYYAGNIPINMNTGINNYYQFVINISNTTKAPSIDGYTQLEMTTTSEPHEADRIITNYAIWTPGNITDSYKIILNSFCAHDAPTTNIDVKYFQNV